MGFKQRWLKAYIWKLGGIGGSRWLDLGWLDHREVTHIDLERGLWAHIAIEWEPRRRLRDLLDLEELRVVPAGVFANANHRLVLLDSGLISITHGALFCPVSLYVVDSAVELLWCLLYTSDLEDISCLSMLFHSWQRWVSEGVGWILRLAKAWLGHQGL
jgi:hypothetical protein